VWKRVPLVREWEYAPSPDDTRVKIASNAKTVEALIHLAVERGFRDPASDPERLVTGCDSE
jgi:hypothetical protein